MIAVLLLAALLLVPVAAGAEMKLPPGFTAHVYVTGEGFDGNRVAGGIPSSSSLVFDAAGTLYAARSGRRYMGGEVEDVWPVFRIPAGGARITRTTEARYLYGPPLPNVQIATTRNGHELLVTTYDRDRGHGVLYRIVDGRDRGRRWSPAARGRCAWWRSERWAAAAHTGSGPRWCE